jgi:hypothetical protein
MTQPSISIPTSTPLDLNLLAYSLKILQIAAVISPLAVFQENKI